RLDAKISHEDVDDADLWLRTLPAGRDIVGALHDERANDPGIAFLARTFVYLGYAQVYQQPFTPDFKRFHLINSIAHFSDALRDRLLNVLQQSVDKKICSTTLSCAAR